MPAKTEYQKKFSVISRHRIDDYHVGLTRWSF